MPERFRLGLRTRVLDRTDDEWIDDLRRRNEPALRDLRVVLVRALVAALRDKVPAQADDLAEDFAQDALLHILDRLGSFRGEARFTTWCARIAVRVALSELRKARWKDVPLDRAPFLAETHADPHSAGDPLARQEISRLVGDLLRTELTERQRAALFAVMIAGMPLGEVAKRLGTNRNALYKLMHDARLRLRRALEARGFTAEDLESDLL